MSCGGGCNPGLLAAAHGAFQQKSFAGYSCGSYGCARRRARAHSSNTINLEGGGGSPVPLNPFQRRLVQAVSRIVSVLLTLRLRISRIQTPCFANAARIERCPTRVLRTAISIRTHEKRSCQCISRLCQSARAAQNSKKRDLFAAHNFCDFFQTDDCPIAAAAELTYCAAQGRDHRPCCSRQVSERASKRAIRARHQKTVWLESQFSECAHDNCRRKMPDSMRSAVIERF